MWSGVRYLRKGGALCAQRMEGLKWVQALGMGQTGVLQQSAEEDVGMEVGEGDWA